MGCLSCVQLCPEAALNIGNITKKRERFPDRNVNASELLEKIIHID
jgi:ferredoxin